MARIRMKGLACRWLLGLAILLVPLAGLFAGRADAATGLDPLAAEVLDALEQRYASSAFTARFEIASTLKAMQVTDTASGRLFVKYPGKMRWEYEAPDPMVFVTDGETVWMFQPRERQVTVGRADEVLGGRQGASFLSDIRLLRRQFEIEIDPGGGDDVIRLKLTPREETFDIAFIIMTVARSTNEIVEVLTVNQYEDRTRIVFHDIAFQQSFPESFFHFEIPEGVDVLQF